MRYNYDVECMKGIRRDGTGPVFRAGWRYRGFGFGSGTGMWGILIHIFEKLEEVFYVLKFEMIS